MSDPWILLVTIIIICAAVTGLALLVWGRIDHWRTEREFARFMQELAPDKEEDAP